MYFLFDALFSSVALGHLIVDVLNSQRSLLFTYWSQQTGMTNTALALVTTIYVWAASLSQPVFGWIADRFGRARLMAAGGILWMAGFFSLALYLPVRWAIPCLVLASLGSAAFHPVGTMQATLRGKMLTSDRETTATSWFFLFGQFGYCLGPMIGGPLLELGGASGLLALAAPALLIGVNAAWRMRPVPVPPRLASPPENGPGAGRQVNPGGTLLLPAKRTSMTALALVAALQAWVQQNMSTFIPKYMSDLGRSPTEYGLMAGLFMGGSAIGNVLGGSLADRLGKKRVAGSMLAMASIPLFLVSVTGGSTWLYLLVPLAGLLTGAVHSIIVVLAQRTIRGGMALASGLTLGFMFSMGALGTLLCGPLADVSGFPLVFQLTSGLAVVAALLTFIGLPNS